MESEGDKENAPRGNSDQQRIPPSRTRPESRMQQTSPIQAHDFRSPSHANPAGVNANKSNETGTSRGIHNTPLAGNGPPQRTRSAQHEKWRSWTGHSQMPTVPQEAPRRHSALPINHIGNSNSVGGHLVQGSTVGPGVMPRTHDGGLNLPCGGNRQGDQVRPRH